MHYFELLWSWAGSTNYQVMVNMLVPMRDVASFFGALSPPYEFCWIIVRATGDLLQNLAKLYGMHLNCSAFLAIPVLHQRKCCTCQQLLCKIAKFLSHLPLGAWMYLLRGGLLILLQIGLGPTKMSFPQVFCKPSGDRFQKEMRHQLNLFPLPPPHQASTYPYT